MTHVAGDWVSDTGTGRIFDALEGPGHRVCFVGGCIRDSLLARAPGDIDLATDARPGRVVELAGAAGMRVIPTGFDHGTVTVISGGAPHEVTTFRRDIRTDGRRAVVTFTTRIEEDAARRDFTMNALYADREGQVIDPLGGLPDLFARRVRFIGDARRRIREDYLRILRFFRFLAWYGDPSRGPDADGLAACTALSSGLEGLSRERVGAEMHKLLDAPQPAKAVATMAVSGCLERILPGAAAKALAILERLEATLEATPDAMRRLAVLGGTGAAGRLRLSKGQARRLDLIQRQAENTCGPAEMAFRFGADMARDIQLVRSARLRAPLPPRLAAEIATGAAARFPVAAADLADEYRGPALGRRLAELERRWIKSGFALSRSELLARTAG